MGSFLRHSVDIQDGAVPSQIYFHFPVLWRLTFMKKKQLCTPNFDQISQSAAKILLLPVAENKCTPYWGYTPSFDLDLSP